MRREGEMTTLAERVGRIEWYHTLELAPGLVTPGWFDTRPIARSVPLPDSLQGTRCLDVGTFDGFWAFEMERRGADEVVALDVIDPRGWDWPANSDPRTVQALGRRKSGGLGFEIAREALGSSVRRIGRSVYDLNPDEDGSFDLVYVGSLLMHLRDPVGALERVRSVCEGMLVVADNIDLLLSLSFTRSPMAILDGRGRPWWWKANVAGLVRMLEAAGFEVTQGPYRVYIPAGAGQAVPRARPRALLSKAGRDALLVRWKGDPHAALAAR